MATNLTIPLGIEQEIKIIKQQNNKREISVINTQYITCQWSEKKMFHFTNNKKTTAKLTRKGYFPHKYPREQPDL